MTTLSAREILQQRGIDYIESRKAKYTTRCPLCMAGYLNVEIKRDGVVWFCAGCEEGGGEYFDKAEKPKADSGLGPIKATYDYVDERGRLLFQVMRFEPLNAPKQFRQRTHPGQEKWSIKGVRIVPFRLPELIEALANEHIVFVVEGEKDVLTLAALGITATCNPMGAGKWRDEFAGYFRDADVVVCCDNDEPGRAHARDVARNLLSSAARVRMLDIAKHWPSAEPADDISDWMAGPGSVDKLWEIVGKLPPLGKESTDANGHDEQAPAGLTFINIVKWSGIEPRPRRFAVPEIIPAANVTLLSGEGGVGKTLLMQQLSVATVIGRDWIGKLPEPGSVIFITAEDDEDEIHFRYDKITRHYGVDFRDLAQLHLLSLAGRDAVMAAVNNKGVVQPTELFERLKRSALEIRPCWIGIDTAADVFIVDERNRSEVRQCISLLRGLALAVNAAVVLLAHPSLSGISSGSGLSGSTAWNNSVRSRLYLKSPKKKDSDEEDDESPVRILEMMKANYSAIAEPVRLVWKDGLLLNESNPMPLDRLSLEANAQSVFLALIERHNKHDMPVSANPNARNFAPKVFATMPEAKALAVRDGGRKRLLRDAMEYLLSKDRLYVGKGPKGLVPSRQSPCLYVGGSLL